MVPIWINDYVGLSFVARGRTRDGIDCYGLVRLIYRDQLGIELPSHLEDYDSLDDHAKIAAAIAGEEYGFNWKQITVTEGELADIVLLRIHGMPLHMGFMIDARRMLHAQEHTNSCIESIHSPQWNRRVLGVFRHAP